MQIPHGKYLCHIFYEILHTRVNLTAYFNTEKIELRERNLGRCCGKSVQWLRKNLEMQEKTIDDRLFSDAESRRDEWNRLKPFFDEVTVL